MIFESYLRRARPRLRRDLRDFLGAKRRDVSGLKPWGRDVLARLDAFTCKGKMIRGALVSLGCEMAGGRPGAAALRAGTALELMQSGLLIHDDIVDRDPRRRGGPSVHEQYARLARGSDGPAAAHYGTSLAICAGDIAIFLAFEAVAGLPGAPRSAAAVQKLFASEFGLVGLGQMLDIEAGSTPGPLPERNILGIYRHKTARYSFFLPFAAGWELGGGRRTALPALERLGQDLGVVFQIRDDELGLFGSAAEIGKPVGSDIREGKKTLYASGLLARAEGADADRLARIFGDPAATEDDIGFVRDLAARSGVREEVRGVTERLSRRAVREIAALPVGEPHREALRGLLEYIVGRTG